MLKFIKRFSFSFQFSFLAVVLFVLFAFVLSIEFLSIKRNLERTAYQTHSNLTKQLSESLAAQFYERYGDVQAFALNPVFRNGTAAEMAKALNRYVELYGLYDLVVIANTEGRIVSVNHIDSKGSEIIHSKELLQKSVVKETWFQNAVQGKFLVDKERGFDGTVFGDLEADPLATIAFGVEKWGTTFSAPIKDLNGKVVGVISNRAGAQWVENEIRHLAFTLSATMHESGEITVGNREGKLLTQTSFPLGGNFQTEDLKFSHDLSRNLINEGWKPYESALIGKSDALLWKDPKTNVEKLLAFSPIASEKFVSDIGWFVSISTDAKRAFATTKNASFEFFSIVLIGCFFIIGIFYITAKKMGMRLLSISKSLEQAISHTTKIGTQVEADSITLATSSHEQAAAIEVSVSSLSEMSSMIAQTSQSVKFSIETAQSVSERTFDGQKIMDRMSDSMSAIQASSSQFEEISRVIENISEKTSVINEIVFKTQLLSFNASIEAARAGQHGRGFAVVAEEVGNLAEMSGQVASEIDSLLQESQTRVKVTLEGIKRRIQEGKHVNEQAVNSFKLISDQINEISSQIRTISEATEQQELGIHQTNTAMKQLDISAQANSRASQLSAGNAYKLKTQVTELMNSKEHLFLFVLGGGHSKVLKSSTPELESSTHSKIPKAAESDEAAELELAAVRVINREQLDPDEAYFKKVV